MPDPDTRWFTARYPGGLSRELRTKDVGIDTARALDEAPPPSIRTYSAIWDTGATHTHITTRVVRECGLAPSGVADSTGIHGGKLTSTYLIDVYLPNYVVARGVQAIEAESLPGPDEVLIGMDILNLGDFAVSNYRGKTTFSFRTPSLEEIDFSPPTPKVGRNALCPCGSGKKYKRCCGAP